MAFPICSMGRNSVGGVCSIMGGDDLSWFSIIDVRTVAEVLVTVAKKNNIF